MELVVVVGLLGLSYMISQSKHDKLTRMKRRAAFQLAQNEIDAANADAEALEKQEAEDFLLSCKVEREAAKEELTRINARRQIHGHPSIQTVADLMLHISATAPDQLSILQSDNPGESRYFEVAQLLVTRKPRENNNNNNNNEDVLI